MPTYEYECLKCGARSERLQSITDPPLKKCVKCRGKLQRLISAGGGLIFKGSGFYATDYKKPAQKTSESPALKAAGKPEPKTEAKPSKDA